MDPVYNSRASPVCLEGTSAAFPAQRSHTQKKDQEPSLMLVFYFTPQSCSVSYQPCPIPCLEFSYCSCPNASHSSVMQKPVPLALVICSYTLVEHSRLHFSMISPFTLVMLTQHMSVILLPGPVVLYTCSSLWLESLSPRCCPDSLTLHRFLQPCYLPKCSLEFPFYKN